MHILESARVLRHMIRCFGVKGGMSAYSAYAKKPHGKLSKIKVPLTKNPVYIRPGTTDWQVFQQVFVAKEYEYSSEGHHKTLGRWYNATIARGETPLIVDCGANIGLSAIWFAEHYPSARVIAIEPEEENFKLLKKNISNYKNITGIRSGVSDVAGSLSLVNKTGAAWSWQTESADDGTIKAITLDDVERISEKAKFFIVKIDIEGGELALMKSNTDWVERVPLLIFEMHDYMLNWQGTGHCFFSVLSKSKRDYLQRGENIFAFSHSMLSGFASEDAALLCGREQALLHA